MSHVVVAYSCQCHMSNLKNANVTCHSLFLSPVECPHAQCHLSILRKSCVAVSNLRVKGHTGWSLLLSEITNSD